MAVPKVISRHVKRLAASLPALLFAWLCSACATTTGDGLYRNRPPEENRSASAYPTRLSLPTSPTPTITDLPSPETTATRTRAQKTLAFGKSYTWDDGVRVRVGKPSTFKPSEFAVVEKSKRYLKFDVTVVNKSNKSIDLGLTYINVRSGDKVADHVFDTPSGLNGPPNKKVSKGTASEFHVGFGVADPKDVVMEIALHDDSDRSSLRYST